MTIGKEIITYKVAPEDKERLMFPLTPDAVLADFNEVPFSRIVTIENSGLARTRRYALVHNDPLAGGIRLLPEAA